MIRLLLFAALYLSNFATVNSLQFTKRGFCAATDGGVFVYDNNRGIVTSYAMNGVKLAAYDVNSGEIAFITKDGVLYVYSPFFETLKQVGIARDVDGIAYSAGIIMLLYPGGTKKYISKLGQPAPDIYIDTMLQVKSRAFPLYLKTRTYENTCHVFKKPISYAPGYDMDFIGTDGNGVYIFDRRMKRLKNTVYINITPPVKKIVRVFDTIYILHASGVTKISNNYISSLSTDCFQYGFSPVDLVYSGVIFLLNSNGFYTMDDPYFFISIDKVCGEPVGAFNIKDEGFITTEHCLLSLNQKGKINVEFKTNRTIEYAGTDGDNIYLVVDDRLHVLKDTTIEEISFDGEPIITHMVISGYGTLYVPAKRGLFILEGNQTKLIRSPFNMLSVVDGVFSDDVLFLAQPGKVVLYDFIQNNWRTLNLTGEQIYGITTISEFEGKLYIGYQNGVLIK